MDIGGRLKEERERLGYSQTDFAELGGASKNSQIAWEKGAAFPNARVLSAIAAVGADVAYILTGQRTAPPTTQPAGISHREAALLANYRACGEEDQRAIDRVALVGAEAQRDGVTARLREAG